MSIIHDALKKVQQGLTPKDDEIQVIDETPPEIETLPPSNQQTAKSKTAISIYN